MRGMGDRSDWGLWALRTALASIIYLITVGGAVWVIGDRLLSHALSGFNAAIAANTQAIEGLRQANTALQEALREEIGNVVAQMDEMGDEMIRTMKEGDDRLVDTMKEGDARLEKRFDDLEERLDVIFARINYETIELPPGKDFFVDEKGNLRTRDGDDALGHLPALLRPGD
jgi:hypothetical protein